MSEIKPLIEKSGYKYEELAEDVFLVHDFITEEERSAYHNIAIEATDVDWTVFYLKSLEFQGLAKYNRSDIASLIEEKKINLNPSWMDKTIDAGPLKPIPDNIAARTGKLLPEDLYRVSGYFTIQRHYPGTHLAEHIDSEHNPNLRYATVVYLNDDYNGGELFFRDLGLRIKPPVRSLMIFSADLLHGVDDVLEGPHRYVATSFIFKKKDND
jgi:hypothetical protein